MLVCEFELCCDGNGGFRGAVYIGARGRFEKERGVLRRFWSGRLLWERGGGEGFGNVLEEGWGLGKETRVSGG